MRSRSVIIAVIVFLLSCSSFEPKKIARYERNFLTEQEIGETSAMTAYDLIQTKRPEFFRMQGPKAVLPPPVLGGQLVSSRLPVVYLNSVRFGYPEDLRRLPAEEVKEVRYLNPTDANLKLGLGHVGGAILVTTKK